MDIKDIKKALDERQVGTVMKHRYFSVLIPLVLKEDRLYLLFEQRARSLKKEAQPGDICFPGGRLNEGEDGLRAALRETKEELGITDIKVLGQFDTVHGFSGYSIYTYVGLVDMDITLNEDEVEEAFLVPLDFFMENEPYVFTADIAEDVSDFPYELYGVSKDYYWGKSSVEMPLYKYQDKNIWGITGRIVRRFVEEICFYQSHN
ncbi:MAG: CoA pyrophosphatase [Clostridia bacterium]|nr:CoA pyrophosphatase [Clostridia bacterium]